MAYELSQHGLSGKCHCGSLLTVVGCLCERSTMMLVDIDNTGSTVTMLRNDVRKKVVSVGSSGLQASAHSAYGENLDHHDCS